MPKSLSLLEKQVNYVVSAPRHFVRLLMRTRLIFIGLLLDTEKSIDLVFQRCAILFMMIVKHPKMKKLILSTPEFLQKNNLTTLIDKWNTLKVENQNTIHLYVLKILVLESTSKEKDFRDYWTPVYKELSEKLSLPIETDLVGLDSNSSNCLLRKQVEQSQLLTTNSIKVQNKNCQRTSCQLSKYIAVDPWEKEDILKTKLVKLKPNKRQRKIIDEWFHTSNYLYNKTIEMIKGKNVVNKIEIRDALVTNETKKTHPDYKIASDEILSLHKKLKLEKDIDEKITIKESIRVKNIELRTLAKSLTKTKNSNISTRELLTPKEIRADTIFELISARKSAISNYKAGNNEGFDFKYRKKNRESNCIKLQPSLIQIKNSKIKIAPGTLKTDSLFYIGKRTLKKIGIDKIEYACRLQKKGGNYHLFIPVKAERVEKKDVKTPVYCGVDPGVRTFLTSFGNIEHTEYIFSDKVKKLNTKKASIKKQKKRKHKKKFNKIDNKKKHIIDELHWKSINHLLKNNDVVFFGDIKTHNIVNSKNHTLNRDINDLKFFLFKQRLLYKSKILRKRVVFVKEHLTTKTCSCCGKSNFPGCSKVYNCSYCKKTIGRDTNASKNILMKGLVQNELYW